MKLIVKIPWKSNQASLELILHRFLQTVILLKPDWFSQFKSGQLTEEDYKQVWTDLVGWLGENDISDVKYEEPEFDFISAVKQHDLADFRLDGSCEKYNPDDPDQRICKNNEVVAALFFALGLGDLEEPKTTENKKDNALTVAVESIGLTVRKDYLSDSKDSFKNLLKIIGGRIQYDSLTIKRDPKPEKYYPLRESPVLSGASYAEDIAIMRTPNLLLFGPPGTGKSRKAKRIAAERVGLPVGDQKVDWDEGEKLQFAHQVKIVQFHAAMSYEDFVEGIRPVVMRDGAIKYEVVPGVVKVLLAKSKESSFAKIPGFVRGNVFFPCEQIWELYDLPKKEVGSLRFRTGETVTEVNFDAPIPADATYRSVYVRDASWHSEANPRNYVILIDEINRGKVAQVFGELLFMIADANDDEFPVEVQTQYSRDRVAWPPNLSIVATMNNTDKTTDDLDQAIKRRFEFELLTTDYDVLKRKVAPTWTRYFGGDVVEWLKELNRRVAIAKESIDFQIGHSFFFKPIRETSRPSALNKLADILYVEIIPTLESMVYRDARLVSQILTTSVYDALYGADTTYLPPLNENLHRLVVKGSSRTEAEALELLAAFIGTGLIEDSVKKQKAG